MPGSLDSYEQMIFTANDGWVCVPECGNIADWEGFQACTSDGTERANDSSYEYVQCLRCHRIARTATGEVLPEK